MTAWNTVGNTKSAGDPILAEEWNNLVDDISAMAEGASGAPRIVAPTALSTTETDAMKVLVPDGSGGVEWQSRGMVYATYDGADAQITLTITATGTWVVTGGMGGTDEDFIMSIWGVVENNAIAAQRSIVYAQGTCGYNDSKLSIPATGTVRIAYDSVGIIHAWLMATRVG